MIFTYPRAIFLLMIKEKPISYKNVALLHQDVPAKIRLDIIQWISWEFSPVPWSSQSKTVRQGDRQQNRRGRRGRCGSGGQWTIGFEENKVAWILRFCDPFPYVHICTYLPARVARIRRLCSWQSTIWLDCTIMTFLLFCVWKLSHLFEDLIAVSLSTG